MKLILDMCRKESEKTNFKQNPAMLLNLEYKAGEYVTTTPSSFSESLINL